MVPLKYLSNFWRTLEMLLVNCEIDIILTWSANCVIVSTAVANQGATFAITDTKVYVPVVTLSTHDIMKLLGLLKSGFERTINSNKCQLKAAIQAQNQYLDYLIDTSFQEVNRLFVLSFEDNVQQTNCNGYFISTVEIKDYNVLIDGANLFDQPGKHDIRTW